MRRAEVDANIATISKEWAAYMTSRLAPGEATLAKGFAEDRRKFMQEAVLPTLTALRANDLKEAGRLAAEKIGPLSVPMERGIEALVKIQVDDARCRLRRGGGALRHDPRGLDGGRSRAGCCFRCCLKPWMVRAIARELGGEPRPGRGSRAQRGRG